MEQNVYDGLRMKLFQARQELLEANKERIVPDSVMLEESK